MLPQAEQPALDLDQVGARLVGGDPGAGGGQGQAVYLGNRADVVAIYVAAEQIYRLIALRNGPAPSLLGFIVRPFVRKLLA